MNLESWNRIHPLCFNHPEFGELQRNPESGEWIQIHPTDGSRTLKAESLKEALAKVEAPYKKARKAKDEATPKKAKKKAASKKLKAVKPAKTAKSKKLSSAKKLARKLLKT